MDGSRFIPNLGVPETVTHLLVGDTNETPARPLTTAPTPLVNAGEYSYAVAQGNTIIVGNSTKSQIIASIANGKPIIQLLTDSTSIYSIHLDGTVKAFDHNGKQRWSSRIAGLPTLHTILANSKLIAASDSGIHAFDIRTGSLAWSYATTLSIEGLVYNEKSKIVMAAISHHSFDANDSILCFSIIGSVINRFTVPVGRITSNLCTCGGDRMDIAFGYLGKPNPSEMKRSAYCVIYSGIETKHPKLISRHELPYLITNLASNGPVVLASGFRETGGDLQSGIDAFSSEDSSKLWQRRLSYPIVTPVAVGEKFAYFSLTFAAQAQVISNSIFYSLDMNNGKTLSELPISGARHGFVMGLPMPQEDKGFILSDLDKPMIYFLRP